MPILDDWNINYITKQINHLQWTDEITGTTTSVAEERTVATVADSGGSLNSTYFHLYSATDATRYYVWYNVNSAGVDPAVTGATGIEVALSTGATANTVASATVAAINSSAGSDFTASGATSPFTLNNDAAGSCTEASNGAASPGFTFTVTQNGVGETVWSVNALYSYLQDTFDELGQMDDQVPMSAQTPTEYSLINNWFIDEVSIKYLKGGAIKTIGWDSNEITTISYDATGGTSLASTDLGLTITGGTTGDTGTIMFFDERYGTDLGVIWIRPDVPASDLFDNATEAFSITTGTGAGIFSTTFYSSGALSGENTWANMYTIGTIESNTAIYVVQDGVKINAWWPVDHIDVLIRVREMGATTGPNSGDLGELFIGAREYSKLFDHFVSTGITGGRNPVPLATSADLNNTTGQYQATLTSASIEFSVGDRFIVSGDPTTEGTVTSIDPATGTTTTIGYYLSGTSLNQFVNSDVIVKVGTTTPTSTINVVSNLVADYGSDITLTFGNTTQDLNNGNGDKDYDVIIDTGGKTVAEMYEWLKFVTQRGYTSSPAQLETGLSSTPYDASVDTADTNIDGEQYIALLDNFTPVKASPFGTFAGGKFFGARGVWIQGYPAADAQNYQLIDATTGATQIPPNTVSVTVNSVVTSDVVGVFPLTSAGADVEKDTYTVNTGASGANTLTVTGLIDTRTPQRGVLRIVDVSDTLLAEQQYEYYSWSTASDGVFTLNSSAARGLTLTATGSGGSATVLIDTDATFRTWRVRPGDVIDNTTDGSTATVVSVDSQTQITTTTLTGGSGNTYDNNDSYTFTTELNRLYTTSDQVYVPIINEVVWTGTEVSNTLIFTAPNIPVIVRVRQGKAILPFEIENTITSTGMTQAAIRTADTIAT